MKTLLYLVVFAVIIWLFIRFFPVDSEPYHEDPGEPDPQRSETRLIGLEAPRYPASADVVLETFVDIAKADGARVVQGDIDEGMVTLMTRSKFFGFRDFITAKAVDEPTGAKLSLLSRPRINGYDWGVNAARLDRWLQEMAHTFAQ